MSGLICCKGGFFSPHYLGSVSAHITKIAFENLWAVKFLNFKKFKHLSRGATSVGQNLMWLNAALTWQIDLKRKKKSSEMNAFTASTSLCPLTSTEYLTFFLLFFLFSLPCPLSCLGDWCSWGEPECERGPPRADEDCLSKACLKTVFLQHFNGCVYRYIQYVCVCMVVSVSQSLSVCLVLVSTPHSLIKGWGKPLTGRLNLKG